MRCVRVLLLLCAATLADESAGRRFYPATPTDKMQPFEGSLALPAPFQPSLSDLESIYCRGELLHDVQLLGIFADSKHFVDMPLKSSTTIDRVNEGYRALQSQREQESLSSDEWAVRLEEFVVQHFDDPGSDLIPTPPRDYEDGAVPPEIARISDSRARAWAIEVHEIWKLLGRVPNTTVVSSFLPPKPLSVPSTSGLARPSGHDQNVLVVPGGRFRESYYWDSYWIVKGLLVSGLRTTARGVVNNLLEYVDELGFVPNGGRIYYLTRSQPPMLSDMVSLIAAVEDGGWDLEYLRDALPLLEREYSFWMRRDGDDRDSAVTLTIKDKTYVLNRYIAVANAPRPESYREDFLNGEKAGNETREQFYNDVVAAAESGWDFSSRWFADERTLTSIATSRVVPVDLNSILYRVETNIAKFNAALGNSAAAREFELAAKRRREAMDAVLWSDADGSWKDFWTDDRRHSSVRSASDYFPLWAGAFDAADSELVDKLVASLKASGLIQEGGIQTTTRATGEQWDSPNAWPPLQDILVEGLVATGSAEARELAQEVVQTWVEAGHVAWKLTGQMFEKYNATQLGGIGSGGEYVPQLGFGWSNGVLLHFLTAYESFVDVDRVFAAGGN